MDRWEWLEGLEPESAIVVAVKHLAGLVADELLGWPPDVDAVEQRFAELLEPNAARPSRPAFDEALQCARWELARDFDAIDHYERNHLRARACPDRRDARASELIQLYILEAFFTLMEKTDNRVTRKDALRGIDWVERRLQVAWNGVVAP